MVPRPLRTQFGTQLTKIRKQRKDPNIVVRRPYPSYEELNARRNDDRTEKDSELIFAIILKAENVNKFLRWSDSADGGVLIDNVEELYYQVSSTYPDTCSPFFKCRDVKDVAHKVSLLQRSLKNPG